MLSLRSRRGAMQARARIGDGLDGHVFVPFHYSNSGSQGGLRAANELTRFACDPVSKQPQFKYAAVSVTLSAVGFSGKDLRAGNALAPSVATIPLRGTQLQARSHVGDYIRKLNVTVARLAEGFAQLNSNYSSIPDVKDTAGLFAAKLLHQRDSLRQPLAHYKVPVRSQQMDGAVLSARHRADTDLDLLQDMQRLHGLAADYKITIDIVSAAAAALRDQSLVSITAEMHVTVAGQLLWLETQLRQAAAQALTVPQ